MPLPEGTKINIVEFFVLPQTSQPTVRMSFDVQMPKPGCGATPVPGDLGMDTTNRRFQTDVVVPDLVQPVTEEARNAILATGWDQVAEHVDTWCCAAQVCPVGKAFDPTSKTITP